MDFLDTCHNAIIRHKKSDMMLNIYIDESYISLPNSKIIIFGYYYPGDNALNDLDGKPQGHMYTECSTIKSTVASTVEAALTGTFVNVQKIIIMRLALMEMKHQQ